MTLTTMVLLALAALIIGFAKTAIGGVATVAVAIYASVVPTRESTAAVLLLFLVGDVVAVWRYRRDADWAILRRLVPAVIPGLALGALFIALVDDTTLRRSIGVLLLVLAALQLVLRWRSGSISRLAHSRTAAVGTGVAAGFTTMAANASGAVMTLYLVASDVEKRRFLGTSALFFFGVNLCKLPFTLGLGLVTRATLLQTLALAPVVLLGTWVGLRVVGRLSQVRFEKAVLAATALSAVALVVH